MRLLVDAQAVQSGSALRGIGRYALSLLQGLVRQCGADRVEVLLNGGDDPARLLRARTAIETFLPARAVHVFDAAWPWTPPYDAARREAAEAAYTAAVRSLDPDAVLVMSLFEGDAENVLAVRPADADPPVAAVLYDLIPALDPGTYLLGPGADVYWRRFAQLRRCDALLAISRYSGFQAEQLLGEACPPVTPVWGGPYEGGFPAFEPQVDERPLDVPARFVLTVGGDHPRKNLDRLVQAWSRVPTDVRSGRPLVVACRLNPGTVRRLRRLARRSGLGPDELLLTGSVSEQTLQQLYATTELFVFPSTQEGLGMPPLEAMAHGAPVVLAQGSSLSELSAEPAFFDGTDVEDMARAVARALTDEKRRRQLVQLSDRGRERFTWEHAADLAWEALRALPSRPRRPPGAAADVVVPWSAARQAGTLEQPSVVQLDEPLDGGAVGPLGLPTGVRDVLAPATALLAPDGAAASAAVRAGALDLPVLVEEDDLDEAARHDATRAYRAALAPLLPLPAAHAADVVEAALRPARWTLQRPRPAWLVLGAASEDLVRGADGDDVDVVLAALPAVALADSADVVALSADDLPAVVDDLSTARRRGTVVVVWHSTGTTGDVPAWCRTVPLSGERPTWPDLAALARTTGRTTGWPWRGEG